MISLKWLPEDYARYKAQHEQMAVSAWEPSLRQMAAEQNLEFAWAGNPDELDLQIASIARFYEVAEARNKAMAEHAIEKMRTEGLHLAVMIIGGFHTEGVSDQLLREGAEVAVVTPQASQETDESLYPKILKWKSKMWQAHTKWEEQMSTLPNAQP